MAIREIQFRSWCFEDKAFIYAEPIYGFFPSIPFRIEQKLAKGETEEEYGDIQMYTGIKDNKGKEIYEGDIVLVDWKDKRYPPHNVEVVWNTKDLCWEIEGGCLTQDCKYFKVIGNIYQNHELLNDKN